MPGNMTGAAQALGLGVTQSYSMLTGNTGIQTRNFGQILGYQRKLKQSDPNAFQGNYNPNVAYNTAAQTALLGPGLNGGV